MNEIRRRSLVLTLAVWLMVFSAVASGGSEELAAERARTFDAVIDVFRRNYWDPEYRDWQRWAEPFRDSALSASSREEFDRILTGMVRALGDQHSTWLGLVTYADEETLSGREQYRFGFQWRWLPGTGIVVERVYPNGPAALAGLQRADVIVRLDDQETTALLPQVRLWDLLASASRRDAVGVEVLRGNSRLRLTMAPEPFELEVARELPQAEMIDDRLGYLYLPSFNRGDIAVRVHRLLAELQSQGLTELVVDLRGNPGGRIGELGLTLGVFVDGTWARAQSRGDVVWQGRYTATAGRGVAWLEGNDGSILLRQYVDAPTSFSGPVAVLVDRSNSSAGELAALVLQALDRAVVVGEPTGGNVEAIRAFDLPDGSVVMVAVANMEGPDGSDFSAGVIPDLLAHEDLRELAHGYDAPLAEAIRLLRGLPFTPHRYFGQSAVGEN